MLQSLHQTVFHVHKLRYILWPINCLDLKNTILLKTHKNIITIQQSIFELSVKPAVANIYFEIASNQIGGTVPSLIKTEHTKCFDFWSEWYYRVQCNNCVAETSTIHQVWGLSWAVLLAGVCRASLSHRAGRFHLHLPLGLWDLQVRAAELGIECGHSACPVTSPCRLPFTDVCRQRAAFLPSILSTWWRGWDSFFISWWRRKVLFKGRWGYWGSGLLCMDSPVLVGGYTPGILFGWTNAEHVQFHSTSPAPTSPSFTRNFHPSVSSLLMDQAIRGEWRPRWFYFLTRQAVFFF